jgi:hypothetical protein
VQDVKTRWHSTFLMAERMVKLHKYIKLIVSDKSQYKNMKINLLDDSELNILIDTVKTLQCFNQLSVLMSGSSYVTCSLIVPSMYYLRKHLSKNRRISDLSISLKTQLLKSLDHYDEAYEINSNSFLLTSTYLDPNYKDFEFCTAAEKKEHMIVIKTYLTEFYTTRNITSFTQEILKENEIKKFKLDFTSDLETDDEISEPDLKKEIIAYNKFKTSDSNVLDFWRNNKKKFPALYCIAKMVLCTTATSVPSESNFSDAGNVLEDNRSRMSPDCFEEVMFLFEYFKF